MAEDRRRSARLRMSSQSAVEVSYQVVDAEGQPTHHDRLAGQALSLTRSGVVVRGAMVEGWAADAEAAQRLLRREQLLALEMQLGAETVRALAAATYLSAASSGDGRFDISLEFAHLPSADAQTLERYLTRRQRGSGRLHRFPGTL